MCFETTNQNFSTKVLECPFALQRFLSGDKALESINRYVKPSPDTLYFGRWSVVWIYLKSPLEWVSACFTTALAGITKCLGLSKTSRVFTVLTRQMSRNSEQLADQWRWGEKLLVPSINAHQTCSWDFYGQGTLPTSAIKNKDLLEKAYPFDELRLFSPKGVCRGACFWFIHLYLKSQSSFSDPEKLLMAVADQFQTGIPREAAFLNAIWKNASLLNHPTERVEADLESLPAGIYRLGLPHHSIIYIKLDDGRTYSWNPSFGLLKLSPKEVEEMIATYHEKLSYIESYTPPSTQEATA